MDGKKLLANSHFKRFILLTLDRGGMWCPSYSARTCIYKILIQPYHHTSMMKPKPYFQKNTWHWHVPPTQVTTPSPRKTELRSVFPNPGPLPETSTANLHLNFLQWRPTLRWLLLLVFRRLSNSSWPCPLINTHSIHVWYVYLHLP